MRIDHVNISVTNLKESIEWYEKVFGFKLVEKGRTPRYEYAIIAHNDSMICMTEQPKRKPADQFDDATAHHIYHFGIRVSDKEKWEQTLKTHGIRLYYGGGEVEYPFSTSWYVHDPSGHEIDVSFTPTEKLQFPA